MCGDEMGLLLSKYVDGEVTEEEKKQVEAHCAACDGCREHLEVFTRNDRMVADALANEAFGNQIIDGVMRKLDEETIPAVPAHRIDWVRWAPVAAAAAMLVAFLAMLLSTGAPDADLRSELDAMREVVETTKTQLLDMQKDQLAREKQDVQDKVSDRLESGGLVGIYSAHRKSIRVTARFDVKQFASFSVWRRPERSSEWELLKEGLQEPSFEDNTAVPGKFYWYKFEARREDGSSVESAAQKLMLPAPDYDPRACIEVECVNVGIEGGVAGFRLTRYVNDNLRSHEFVVRRGEEVGKVVEIKGAKIDFRTGLILSEVEEGEQTMVVKVASPVIDEATGIDVEKPGGEKLMRTDTKVVHIRPNRKATLRRPGQEKSVTVWRNDDPIFVPVP